MPSPGRGVRTEPMTGAHAAAVLAIYQTGIEEGNATFEACARQRPAQRGSRRSGRVRASRFYAALRLTGPHR
jgi:phosphinothricin acetyltransferase